MDTKRLLIAAALSMAVMLAWSYFFPPPEPPQRQTPTQEPAALEEIATPVPEEPPEVVVEEVGEPASISTEEPVAESVSAEREQLVVVETAEFRAEMTNRGAQLVSYQLLKHKSADGGPVDLVRRRAAAPYPFGLATPQGAPSPLNEVLYRVEQSSTAAGGKQIFYRYRGPEGNVEKRFVFRGDGMIEVDLALSNPNAWTVAIGPGVRNPSEEEQENRFARRSAVFKTAEDVEREDPNRTWSPLPISPIGLSWAGLEDSYFLTAVVPQEGVGGVIVQPVLVVPGVESTDVWFKPIRGKEELSDAEKDLPRELFLLIQPSAEGSKVLAYLGPKEYDHLSSLPYGLEETVNLGFFKPLSLPLMWGLAWIYDNVVSNYGWAIILMTILIRILLFPLTHKSTVSMQKMQKLNPKIQAIRQKYKGKLKDKQGRPNAEMQRKMNEETMALYKTEGVSPAGGCLPMFLQIPVLFAFYSLLTASIELRGAPWILWIQDLSAKDPLYVLPIIMGASQFLQQKMTPAAGDPMQRRMFAMMPIFFTVLFLGFPSGLVLYWLTNNVLGIAQSYAYKRHREKKEAESGATSSGKRLNNGKKKEAGK
ncbi:MAG: membrane protein insertase YidC [Thermoanaerobaculia bacterium]